MKRKGEQDSQDHADQFNPEEMHLSPSLPNSLSMLCMWGVEGFKNNKAVTIYIEPEVFGYPIKTFLLGSDVRRMGSMGEITGNCILIYQRYLYEAVLAYQMEDMVAFIEPDLVGSINSKARYIKDKLVAGKPGQLFLMPFNTEYPTLEYYHYICNCVSLILNFTYGILTKILELYCSSHWVLNVLNAEEGKVYFLDSARRRLPLVNEPMTAIIDTAMGLYNSQRASWTNLHLPGNLWGFRVFLINLALPTTECGYYVMRYMRDIIEDKELSFATKWEKRDDRYTQANINEVRDEWAKYINMYL